LRWVTQMIQAMGVTLARWRRPVFNGLLTIGPPLMLLSFLIAIDDRVREQLTLRLAPAHGTQALIAAGSTARSLASVLIEAGRDQSLAHAPMLIFAMAAAVLTLFMVRT
jgi:chromate transport protein ChrA